MGRTSRPLWPVFDSVCLNRTPSSAGGRTGRAPLRRTFSALGAGISKARTGSSARGTDRTGSGVKRRRVVSYSPSLRFEIALAEFSIWTTGIDDARHQGNQDNDREKDHGACHCPLRWLNRLNCEQSYQDCDDQTEKGNSANDEVARAQHVRLAAFILRHPRPPLIDIRPGVPLRDAANTVASFFKVPCGFDTYTRRVRSVEAV